MIERRAGPLGGAGGPRADGKRALACALGADMDLIRPLGLAGITCAVVARSTSRLRFSRFTAALVDSTAPGDLVERLLDFARAQPEPPVVFYESDWSLEFLTRHRDRMAEAFRFVLPDSDLVAALVDKGRFQSLALERQLPVPRSEHFHSDDGSSLDELDLTFPVIVKPLPWRQPAWETLGFHAKVLRVESHEELRRVSPRLAGSGLGLLVQEFVPGPESRIESYHVYIDERGRVAGEFTGRKIRTLPPEFGFTTSLTTTDAPDVAMLGREVVERLGLRGVAKVDFKRGPDGRLHLLEVNPRFTLWCHVGAVAGVNLPALVYADLVGMRRPSSGSARAGVTWLRPVADATAARAAGHSMRAWARWALSADTNSAFALDDPMPAMRGQIVPALGSVLRQVTGGGKEQCA